MAYQLYKKMKNLYSTHSLSTTNISIHFSGFGFGTEISKEFEEDVFVEIYIDRDDNTLGFRSTKSCITGFKGQFKNGKSMYLVAKKVAKILPKGLYESVKEGNMWVIKVPFILEEE